MMGKIFAIFIAMLFASVASANGALAIDSNQGDQYGFSYNHGSMQQAQSRALSECGYGCRVVQTFSRGCAAYAADLDCVLWAEGENGGGMHDEPS